MTTVVASINLIEEDVPNLKKQLRSQETDFKKAKAILEQQIEILSVQNIELKVREESLKKMNESIMRALDEFSKDNGNSHAKAIKELEFSKDILNKDFTEYKIRQNEITKNLEREVREWKEKANDIETKYNNIILHYEKNEIGLQQKVQGLESEKKSLAVMLKLFEEEKRQLREKEATECELHSRIGEMRFIIEKQKEEYSRDIDRIQSECNQQLKSMKKLFESEKSALEAQLAKLQDSSKIDQKSKEEIKKHFQEELFNTRRERDEALNKVEMLEPHIKQLNETIKGLEAKFHKMKHAEDEEEKVFRAKVYELEIQIKKHQQTEKSLKLQVSDKDQELETLKSEYKKKLSDEKRRTESLQENLKKVKDEDRKVREDERKVSELIIELSKKEESIKKLKQQVKELESRKPEPAPSAGPTSLINVSIINSKSELNKSQISDAKSLMKSKKANPNYRYIGDSSKNLRSVKSPNSKTPITPKSAAKQISLFTNQTLQTEQDHPEDIDQEEQNVANLTSENILAGLNSPRPFISTVKPTLASLSSKKSVAAINNADEVHQTNENFQTKQDEDTIEIKKKSNSVCENKYHIRPYLVSSQAEHSKTPSADFDLSRNFIVEVVDGVPRLFGRGMSLAPSMAEFAKNYKELYDIIENQTPDPHGPLKGDEKYKVLEEKLKKTEEKLEKVLLEKDKIQVELDRLILELKQTKMEWALSEERKEESELALKNEIKYLINKLLQARGNSNSNLTSSRLDLSQLNVSQQKVNPLMASPSANCSMMMASGGTPTPNLNVLMSHNGQYGNVGQFASFADMRTLSSPNTKVPVEGTDRKVAQNLSRVFQGSEFKENTPVNKFVEVLDIPVDGFNDSPRRVSEFHYNEKNIKMNAMKESNNTQKKLIQHLKN